MDYYDDRDYSLIEPKHRIVNNTVTDNSRTEWHQLPDRNNVRSNHSQESGFGSDISNKYKYSYRDNVTSDLPGSDCSDIGSVDDATITPDDAIVIFPDGTIRRIKAQQMDQFKNTGTDITIQSEYISQTLKRKKKETISV